MALARQLCVPAVSNFWGSPVLARRKKETVALLAMLALAGALLPLAWGGAPFGASAGEGHPYRAFVPLAAADNAGPPVLNMCAGDVAFYLNSSGANVAVENFHVEGTDIATRWFHFTNPCDEWIAPQRLTVTLTGDFGELDASIGAFPSLVPPGGDGYYALYYNQALFDEAGLDYPPQEWTWEEFIDLAKLLTVDANGNDATSPEFDPELVVQFGYQATAIARHQGNPVVWPFELGVRGVCQNGSPAFGRFTPYDYGYAPGGVTSFDGYVSWLADSGCNPDPAFRVLGYLLDSAFVSNAAGAQPNTLLPSSLTLLQGAPGFMNLSGSLTNTGQAPARPGLFDVDLIRDDGGAPFEFQLPGVDQFFPGHVGNFVIGGIPGNAADYSGVSVGVSSVLTLPDAVVPAWVPPPTFIRGIGGNAPPGSVDAYSVAVYNLEALNDAYGGQGKLTSRAWFHRSSQVIFRGLVNDVPLAGAPRYDAFEHLLVPGAGGIPDGDLMDELAQLEADLALIVSHEP